MLSNRKPVVIIFARAPRLGLVKKRLASSIGRYRACKFHFHNTNRLIRRLSVNPYWETKLYVSPEDAQGICRIWPMAKEIFGQCFGDLGKRMEQAMLQFETQPVLLVGSDIPEVNRNDVLDGFKALETHDLVFGPAFDGGYWLTGLKFGVFARNLYRNVRWSSPHTLIDTLSNAKGRSVAELRKLNDIDYFEDYKRWLEDK